MFKNKKDLLIFLLLEILTVPTVIFIFKFVSPRNVAALLAGSVFVTLGAYILKISWPYRKSIILYAIGLHLFGFALPMLLMRLINWSSDFEKIKIFGLAGPQFHRVSEIFFTVLIFCTLIDLVRVTLSNEKRSPLYRDY